MTAKTKFEQLIEYVINDEEQKAQELFHDIVVEKSREIYENIMNEEDAEEVEESEEEEVEESVGGTGSEVDNLRSEVEVKEEEGDEPEFDEEPADDEEHDGEEECDSEEGNEVEGDIEDRVVDIEDKLDELMAEFEALMGDEGHEEHDGEFDMEPVDGDVGGDAMATDDTSEFEDMPMTENIDLVKVPAVKHGDNGANAKSPTAFNSGAHGMAGKPVHNTASESNPDGTAAYKAPTSYADKGRGDLPGAGKFKNVPAKDGSKLEPVAKPKGGDNGSNSRTPFPKG